jgi:hypothetical protein
MAAAAVAAETAAAAAAIAAAAVMAAVRAGKKHLIKQNGQSFLTARFVLPAKHAEKLEKGISFQKFRVLSRAKIFIRRFLCRGTKITRSNRQ